MIQFSGRTVRVSYAISRVKKEVHNVRSEQSCRYKRAIAAETVAIRRNGSQSCRWCLKRDGSERYYQQKSLDKISFGMMKWLGLSVPLTWTEQQRNVHLKKRKLLSLAWSHQLMGGVTIHSIVFQLKKCVACVLRNKSRLRCAFNKRKRGETMAVAPPGEIEPLDISEIENAERAIIKATQFARFHDELTSFSSLEKVVKKSSGISIFRNSR